MSLMKRARIPVLLCDEQTFTVSSHVTEMVFKINPEDTDKIAEVEELVSAHVDVDGVLKAL
jgi:BioD-like phosphotransacetylase family protein